MREMYKFMLLLGWLLCSAWNVNSENVPAKNWYRGYNDTLCGINIDKAYEFLYACKLKPRKQIVIGVIDSGIDTTAVDLATSLWINSKEKVDGKDNDKNGYIDDLHGWNFLGTKDGSFNMISAGTEEFREFKRLYPKYKDIADDMQVADSTEFLYYQTMKKKAGIVSYIKFAGYVGLKDKAYTYIDSLLASTSSLAMDTLTVQGLLQLKITDEKWSKSVEMLFTDFYKQGNAALWTAVRKNHDEEFALMKTRLRSIEQDPDKRLLMGDDMKNPCDCFYGNPILQVDGYEHGTFVAGVIAGQGLLNSELVGVWPEGRLMILRAVPNGDEYDKDIASAIRYAVDNGAKVINMSLGKYTSPDAWMVTEAIAYAQQKDVLIVHAAGNNHKNLDSVAYYPSSHDTDETTFPNYIRVGASDRNGQPCNFSNYGKSEVDLFAPGEKITSVAPGNKYMTSQGTSVAAPIVSGVAAMLRAYFPKLKAAQIKEILIRTVRSNDALKNNCVSGGVIDVYEAVKMAVTYK